MSRGWPLVSEFESGGRELVSQSYTEALQKRDEQLAERRARKA